MCVHAFESWQLQPIRIDACSVEVHSNIELMRSHVIDWIGHVLDRRLSL